LERVQAGLQLNEYQDISDDEILMPSEKEEYEKYIENIEDKTEKKKKESERY